jgi:hypothetical protein
MPRAPHLKKSKNQKIPPLQFFFKVYKKIDFEEVQFENDDDIFRIKERHIAFEFIFCLFFVQKLKHFVI